MHVHVLQHVPFEGLGCIGPWLESRGARISWTRWFQAGAAPPPLDGIDLLIALGGPMSVNDGARLPWLLEEKAYVGAAVHSGMPVLGICLGAQLIAAALGALVVPAERKEIGWFPLSACGPHPEGFVFPDSVSAFHWHGETFALPPGAVHLARSEACAHQAFQVGSRTIGLQCHLETTPAAVEALIRHCGEELVADRFVQSEAELRAVTLDHCGEANALMEQVLAWLLREPEAREA